MHAFPSRWMAWRLGPWLLVPRPGRACCRSSSSPAAAGKVTWSTGLEAHTAGHHQLQQEQSQERHTKGRTACTNKLTSWPWDFWARECLAFDLFCRSPPSVCVCVGHPSSNRTCSSSALSRPEGVWWNVSHNLSPENEWWGRKLGNIFQNPSCVGEVKISGASEYLISETCFSSLAGRRSWRRTPWPWWIIWGGRKHMPLATLWVSPPWSAARFNFEIIL